jgi:hypothetical protein
VTANARVAGPLDGWPTSRYEIPVHVYEAGRRRVEFTAGDEPITVIMKRFQQ